MTDTEYIDDFITWLCSLSKPATHRNEKKQFIELHANPDTLGSAEFILEVNPEEGIIVKEDKLSPGYKSEKYEISFERHVLNQVRKKVENSFLELEEPYFSTNFLSALMCFEPFCFDLIRCSSSSSSFKDLV